LSTGAQPLTNPSRIPILTVLDTDSIGGGMELLPASTTISDQAIRWLMSQLAWEGRLAQLREATRAVPAAANELADRRDQRAAMPATRALPAAS
jgi:hypothetical protein